jgi:2,3-bisphosphoglycerate-independent phosphoglycerate mutase
MQNQTRKKPIFLCILDGFGIGDASDKNNAVARAQMPHYKRFLQQYPHSSLMTSGLDVGLPEGQIGNSEVGHMTIGAGRIIFQDLPRINNSISEGNLAQNDKLQKLISDLKASGKTCHLMGLLSDGGVHSHINHINFLADLLTENGVKTVIHAFLDGRDVAQKSALTYLNQVKHHQIATLSGRYFAMDRDKKWDRIELATNAIVNGKESPEQQKFHEKNVVDCDGNRLEGLEEAALNIIENYNNNITDEFIKPCVIGDYSGITEGDAMIFCNFRADRARQISEKLLEEAKFSTALALTEYSETLNKSYQILFPSIEVKNSLPEILEQQNLTQLRAAETEKYAHVTFFLSAGREAEFRGEERILVKSPAVATYDLQPEMSSVELGEKLRAAINSAKFDFIVVNYANCDMVGHSGMLTPAIKACEAIDAQLGMLEKVILEQDGLMLITADHGNIECMLDEHGNPGTTHSTNPVPFVLIGNEVQNLKLEDGGLSDIAPTILHLMNIEKPAEMTGKNLVK